MQVVSPAGGPLLKCLTGEGGAIFLHRLLKGKLHTPFAYIVGGIFNYAQCISLLHKMSFISAGNSSLVSVRQVDTI
jgi:hypothetical protein